MNNHSISSATNYLPSNVTVNRLHTEQGGSAAQQIGKNASPPEIATNTEDISHSVKADVGTGVTSINNTPNIENSAKPLDPTEVPETNKQQKQSGDATEESGSESDFSDVELKQISSLKSRDAEVIQHERAHASVGGQYTGAPSYSYKTGPDGVQYAISGEVSIDTSIISGNPQATLQKAQTIRAAALAPAQPSSQDMRVAAQAATMAQKARSDILNNKDGKVSAGFANHEHHQKQRLTGEQVEIKVETLQRSELIANYYANTLKMPEESSFHLQG